MYLLLPLSLESLTIVAMTTINLFLLWISFINHCYGYLLKDGTTIGSQKESFDNPRTFETGTRSDLHSLS